MSRSVIFRKFRDIYIIKNRKSKNIPKYFFQAVPELYQLSKAELNCLWENNKDVMLVLVLAETFNTK